MLKLRNFFIVSHCKVTCAIIPKAEVCSSFIATTVWEQHPRSNHKGATGRVQTGTNCIQFYDIANLDKTSLPQLHGSLPTHISRISLRANFG